MQAQHLYRPRAAQPAALRCRGRVPTRRQAALLQAAAPAAEQHIQTQPHDELALKARQLKEWMLANARTLPTNLEPRPDPTSGYAA